MARTLRTLYHDKNSISTLLDCDNHTTGVPAEIPTGCSKTSDSSNFQLPFIIVCVILLIVILLVLIFRLYRRRALCFGKMKKQKKTDNNLHGELQDVENNEEPIYEVCYNSIQDSILSRARLERQDPYKPKQYYV